MGNGLCDMFDDHRSELGEFSQRVGGCRSRLHTPDHVRCNQFGRDINWGAAGINRSLERPMPRHLCLSIPNLIGFCYNLPPHGFSIALSIHWIGTWGTYGCWPYARYEDYSYGGPGGWSSWGCNY